ncbi:nicotinate-nucleotide--dimethylbenzimidazole phosphoribosyltransferase [Porphyromonadaceae bacterium W3.11]|nr:nicotinate-nucleotide--dimethylbenzimidazole phosphoribosyltransferase [Porphyromonadaceae bacterium W3.11]
MKDFKIERLDDTFRKTLLQRLDDIAKPKGSLGRLEEIALKVGLIQKTLKPHLSNPHHILFSGDHGVEVEHISKSPREVTWQQTLNFMKFGTAIAYLCKQHGIKLEVVDSGVDYDFPKDSGIIDYKVRKGTSNYLHTAAMSHEEMELCIDRGAERVRKAHEDGCNVISFGEMGISNTSSSALWMHEFTGVPLSECIGAGSGLNSEELLHKLDVLQRAEDNYKGDHSPKDILSYFGGFEMVMTVGAMLQAAELKMVILIDGFIMTACILAASKLEPNVLEYAIFGHKGDEKGHSKMLDYLNVQPILDLGMKLGEGTGAVTAYPIVESAVLMMTEMHTWSGMAESKNLIEKYF